MRSLCLYSAMGLPYGTNSEHLKRTEGKNDLPQLGKITSFTTSQKWSCLVAHHHNQAGLNPGLGAGQARCPPELDFSPGQEHAVCGKPPWLKQVHGCSQETGHAPQALRTQRLETHSSASPGPLCDVRALSNTPQPVSNALCEGKSSGHSGWQWVSQQL